MNLRELEYVVAIGRHLNFSKAAAACNVSQPALSNQIKKLELELGMPLFTRSNSEIRPTALGAKVIGSAKRVLAETQRIQDIATEFRDPTALPLRIGLVPTLAPYLMHYLRTHISSQAPQMKVKMVEGEAGLLAEQVASREIDIAVMPKEVYEGALEFAPLFDEKLFLVVNGSHRLSTETCISLYDIPFMQLVRLQTPLGFTSENRIHPTQNSQRPVGTDDVETTNLETICRHIRYSSGCTIIPTLAVEQLQKEGSDLAFVPIVEEEERRRIGVVSRIGCPRRPLLESIIDRVHKNLPLGTDHPIQVSQHSNDLSVQFTHRQ